MRTAELTLPGFYHDICSAVHPLAELSLFFRSLPLQQYGLEWIHPPASVAHPMDNGPAVLLERSIERTSQSLAKDARRYRSLLDPFVEGGLPLFDDLAAPLHWPRHPLSMARFGAYGLQSAARLAGTFQTDRARALLAGCAGHSILPLTRALSGAVGLLFLVAGHLTDWPVARGGSRSITLALARYFELLGGDLVCSQWIRGMRDLPPARAYIFDTSPMQLAQVAGDELPVSYLRRLARYRYGPGVYKLNWALSEPIPWKDPRCALASTVHVGGTLEEIAESEQDAWTGRITERPFLILAQQSHFDTTRAPAGQHTGYGYCHVPFGCVVNMTERIEDQIERFAPGFRDTILMRHVQRPTDLEHHNPNLRGGVIAGGVADITQFFTRPVARLVPYTTPNRKIFICSAATPPGGGIHGLGGYYAAKAVMRSLARAA